MFKSFETFLEKVLIKLYITHHASFFCLWDYAIQSSQMQLLQDMSDHEVLESGF